MMEFVGPLPIEILYGLAFCKARGLSFLASTIGNAKSSKLVIESL